MPISITTTATLDALTLSGDIARTIPMPVGSGPTRMNSPSIHTTTPTPAQEIADAIIEGLALAIVRYGSDEADEGSRLYRAIMASALVDIWPHGSEALAAPGEDDLSLSDAINSAWVKAGAADAVWLAFPTTVQF